MSHTQVRGHVLGEFIQQVIDKSEQGYHFSEHEVYRLGREYIADMRIPVATATFSTTAVEHEDVPAQLEETISDLLMPDWTKLDEFVTAEDKDGMELYCKQFGIDLSKRKSPANMLKQFKTHVGA